MSSTTVRDVAPEGAGAAGEPRVRERARDAVALMVFSLGSAGVLTAGLLLVVQLGR